MSEGGEPRARPLILVVDDDESVRDVMVEALTDSGFDAITAADGERALDLALRHHPAVVLVDVMMRGMDGYTLVTRLRAEPATRGTPVVVVTGEDAPVYRTLSLGLGAVAHLTKPVSVERLTQAVRLVLAGPDRPPVA
jgi:CheY-like chemotaxis protein